MRSIERVKEVEKGEMEKQAKGIVVIYEAAQGQQWPYSGFLPPPPLPLFLKPPAPPALLFLLGFLGLPGI